MIVPARGGSIGIEKIPARYCLLEISTLLPSHQPLRNFSPTPGYPPEAQERDYRLQAERGKVEKIAQDYEPSLIFNSAPGALDGLPVVNEQKFVLGGNGRTMATMLAYGEGDERPKEYLRKHAREFGLRKEDVDQYAEPMVVRTIRTGGDDAKTLASWSRRLNAALSQQLDKIRLAVSRARFVDNSVLRELDKMEPEESLSDFLSSERSLDFVKALQSSGVIDSRSAKLYLTGEGLLNADGRGLVVELLVARMLKSADVIEALGPGVIQTLARSAGYLIPTESLGDYNLIPYLRDAAAARVEMRVQKFTSMKQYLRQGGLGQKQRTKEEETFFLIFYDLEDAPIRMSKFAKRYLQLSKAAGLGQGSMFGAPSVLGNMQEAARAANVKV